MTGISSFKPLSESNTIATNQIRAHQSWVAVFDSIVYFGALEKQLYSSSTQFIEWERRPRIVALVAAAALSKDLACIVNADIVLARGIRDLQVDRTRFGGMKTWHGLAYYSRRYEYDPRLFDLHGAKLVDQGVDFFAAYPDVWKRCLKTIPEDFRIGCSGWDNWMIEFMRTNYGSNFKEITNQRLVFHPKHQERNRLF